MKRPGCTQDHKEAVLLAFLKANAEKCFTRHELETLAQSGQLQLNYKKVKCLLGTLRGLNSIHFATRDNRMVYWAR